MVTPVREGTTSNPYTCGPRASAFASFSPSLSAIVAFLIRHGVLALGDMQAPASHLSAPQNLEHFSR